MVYSIYIRSIYIELMNKIHMTWWLNNLLFFLYFVFATYFSSLDVCRHIVTAKHSNTPAIPLSSYRLSLYNGLIWSFVRHVVILSFIKVWEIGHWTLVWYSKRHWLHSFHIALAWTRVFECTHSSKCFTEFTGRINPIYLFLFMDSWSFCYVLIALNSFG